MLKDTIEGSMGSLDLYLFFVECRHTFVCIILCHKQDKSYPLAFSCLLVLHYCDPEGERKFTINQSHTSKTKYTLSKQKNHGYMLPVHSWKMSNGTSLIDVRKFIKKKLIPLTWQLCRVSRVSDEGHCWWWRMGDWKCIQCSYLVPSCHSWFVTSRPVGLGYDDHIDLVNSSLKMNMSQGYDDAWNIPVN